MSTIKYDKAPALTSSRVATLNNGTYVLVALKHHQMSFKATKEEIIALSTKAGEVDAKTAVADQLPTYDSRTNRTFKYTYAPVLASLDVNRKPESLYVVNRNDLMEKSIIDTDKRLQSNKGTAVTKITEMSNMQGVYPDALWANKIVRSLRSTTLVVTATKFQALSKVGRPYTAHTYEINTGETMDRWFENHLSELQNLAKAKGWKFVGEKSDVIGLDSTELVGIMIGGNVVNLSDGCAPMI